MGFLGKFMRNKIINSNGYTKGNGTSVHSYLRTHPRNKGITKKAWRSVILGFNKKNNK